MAGEDNDYVTDLIRSVCKPYGFTPKIQPVHSTDAMIMGVQCGLGVAVTDSWSRALDTPGFAYLPLESTHPLSLVWRRAQGSCHPQICDNIKKNDSQCITKWL